MTKPTDPILPADADRAILIGRVSSGGEPCVCAVRGGDLVDVTLSFPTIAHVLREPDRVRSVLSDGGRVIGSLGAIAANMDPDNRDPSQAGEARDAPGEGFTHKIGDFMSIACDRLGTLSNQVGLSSDLPPWSYGALDLFRSLAKRNIAY